METPSQLQSVVEKQEDIAITHRDYRERTVIAVDFGPNVKPSINLVGKTVIVDIGDQQFEFDRPPKANESVTNNDMLVIKE